MYIWAGNQGGATYVVTMGPPSFILGKAPSVAASGSFYTLEGNSSLVLCK